MGYGDKGIPGAIPGTKKYCQQLAIRLAFPSDLSSFTKHFLWSVFQAEQR